jgi:hypothetical protein
VPVRAGFADASSSLHELDLTLPAPSAEQSRELDEARRELEAEKSST